MPVTTNWDDEAQTTVRMVFAGKWSWDEYHSATTRMSSMVKSATQTVDMIIDFNQSGPLLGNALSNFGSSLKLRNDNVGMVVVIQKLSLSKHCQTSSAPSIQRSVIK